MIEHSSKECGEVKVTNEEAPTEVGAKRSQKLERSESSL